MLDTQVFGKVAGSSAASFAAATALPPTDVARLAAVQTKISGMQTARGLGAGAARKQLQRLMSRAASVVRTEKGLADALAELQRLRAEGISVDASGLADALETRNLLDASEAILRACLARKESRGPHLFFRDATDLTPLPRRDPEFQHYTAIKRVGDALRLEARKPLPLPS
ncbi:MAG: hypothetical protein FJ272_12250 [Planctomycetes bacterium]|nr:hypothetical protein [Planctomycetota bacterium]